MQGTVDRHLHIKRDIGTGAAFQIGRLGLLPQKTVPGNGAGTSCRRPLSGRRWSGRILWIIYVGRGAAGRGRRQKRPDQLGEFFEHMVKGILRFISGCCTAYRNYITGLF